MLQPAQPEEVPLLLLVLPAAAQSAAVCGWVSCWMTSYLCCQLVLGCWTAVRVLQDHFQWQQQLLWQQ
jgi:hypothetical protein